MNVQEFNNTPQGRLLMKKVVALQKEINSTLTEVRRATEQISDGAYVDWDDSGFFEETDI